MAKKKKARKLIGFVYIFIGCVLIYTLFSSTMSIFEHQNEIKELSMQKETLQQEMASLQNEIDLLSNDDYITRYARENYVFTREGEKVAIIPIEKK